MGTGHIHAAHDHRPARGRDERLLVAALALICLFLFAEVAVGVVAGSLVLLADAGHMLTDAAALGGSLWASRLARRPARGAWTFGLHRAEILAAAMNGVSLAVLGAVIFAESVRRLWNPPPVAGGAVLSVALVGVLANLAATALLARADRSSLNLQGAFAHIVTDLYAFAGTAAAGLILLTTGYRRADPLASLIVVVLMARTAWGLLRSSGWVLLEGAPEAVDLAAVRAHLLGNDHVHDVHDLHCWTVTSDLPALSAHVVVDTGCFLSGHAPQLLDELQRCLVGHFDVEHSTFQLEPVGHNEHEAGAHN